MKFKKKKSNSVKTKEFMRSSVFSKALRYILKSIIIPLADKENQKAYKDQFDKASRNIEITIAGLLKLILRRPIKAAYIANVISNWISSYFGVQKSTENKKKYLVYTKLDEKIPFIPQEDIMYTYMFSQIAYVANELAGITSAKQMKKIAQCFIDLNNLGVEVFNKYPTVMPRFLNHKRLSLKLIQELDKPLNCCPSLHIAYSIFLDNIGENLIAPHKKKKDVFESIRYSTIRMFNSVLYVKQHALVDVAFGILCAKIVFEDNYSYPFNDFLKIFDSLKSDHPHIEYDEITRIYKKALAIYTRTDNFVVTVGSYLKNNGYKLQE